MGLQPELSLELQTLDQHPFTVELLAHFVSIFWTELGPAGCRVAPQPTQVSFRMNGAYPSRSLDFQ